MSNSNLKSFGSTLVLPLRLVAFAAVLVFLMQAGKAQAAGSFNPSFDIELSDYNACATANVTSLFTIPDGDMNFQVNVTFTPEDWYVARSADIPIGATVGQLSSQSTLGLLSNPCNQLLQPNFTMQNATVDMSDELARAAPPDEPQDSAIDNNGNGILDGAEHYPVWLKDDSVIGSLQPIFRSIGLDSVSAAGTNIVLQFVIFEPGTCLPNSPCPPPAGYPSVTVLQDPTTVGPSAITDFCAPLASTNITYGLSLDNPGTAGVNESGYVVRRNPVLGGTYEFGGYARSYYNADGDPYENYLDSCPFAVNTEDPTATCGPDGDCLDSICDPAPSLKSPTSPGSCSAGSMPDYDQDCYPDPGDNCPLVANGIDKNSNIIGPNNQLDTDQDYIGDACDIGGNGPFVPDGVALSLTDTTDVDVVEVEDCDGDGMASAYEVEHECLDPVVDDAADDADGDGVSNIDEMTAGTDPCVAETAGGETPTATATASPTATATVEGSPTVEASPTPTETVVVETCPPVFPGTYSGLVRVNGQPAASGYNVTASVGDLEWGSAIVSGGRYAMDIPDYMPSEPPCFEGGAITFTLDGMVCTPSPDWASGLHTVDLSCVPAASPTVTPTEVPTTPTAPATPVKTPTVAPPSGGGGLLGSSSGLPLWGMALAGWVGLTIVAGLGTLVAVKRR